MNNLVPTPEQVEQWREQAIALHNPERGLQSFYEAIATQAAKWGAAEQLKKLAAGVTLEPFEVFTEDEPNSIIAGYTREQLAAARVQALEQAAKVCDVTPPQPFRPSIEAAWAIRALIGANHG